MDGDGHHILRLSQERGVLVEGLLPHEAPARRVCVLRGSLHGLPLGAYGIAAW